MPIPSGTTTALVARLAGAAVTFRAAALQALLRKANFNPNQPRVPRGNPDGGQWTRVGAPEGDDSTLVAQGGPPGIYSVDLYEEERRGGHTIANHVGKSPQSLLERILRTRFQSGNRIGSFPSIAAATRLVNATLARNRAIVDLVASGALSDAFVTASFRAPTGIEYFRENERQQPILRDTYGVGIQIIHSRWALEPWNSRRRSTSFSARSMRSSS
jgi:hypothetical protein